MPPIRKRCKRLHETGDAHFATYSCFRRMPLLNTDRSRRWFLDALAAACQNHEVALWAFCLMPEHVHLVYSAL